MTASDLLHQGRAPVAKWGLVLVMTLVAGLGLGWAGRELLAPPKPLSPARDFALVAVEQGSVQRSINLNVAASWSGGPAVLNQRSGVLTQLVAGTGRVVAAGEVLYSVDLQPVVVASGAVPAFRDLEPGSRGRDVAQLQAMLRATGVRSSQPDGVFGPGTAREVRAWQVSIGAASSGSVPLGSLVFVSRLPGVISWASDVSVGATLAPGAAVAHVLPDEPRFSMALPSNQLALVTTGMAVEIRRGDRFWHAQIASIGATAEDGSARAVLLPRAGGPSICAEQCSTIPSGGDNALVGKVIVVPERRGPVIPSAALVVDDGGSSAVTTADGRSVPVDVVAGSGGRVVVRGLAVGQQVRVPGGSPPGAGQ